MYTFRRSELTIFNNNKPIRPLLFHVPYSNSAPADSRKAIIGYYATPIFTRMLLIQSGDSWFEHGKHTPGCSPLSLHQLLIQSLQHIPSSGYIVFASFLVCDLNRTPIVMAKHGGPCVHFSGISTCGATSRETVSHPQHPPLPTLCKILYPSTLLWQMNGCNP